MKLDTNRVCVNFFTQVIFLLTSLGQMFGRDRNQEYFSQRHTTLRLLHVRDTMKDEGN